MTGTGVLTSLGTGKQDNWRELTAGHSGIRRIIALPDRRPAHQHRRHGGFRAGGRAIGAGPVRAPRRTRDRGGDRRSRHRHAGDFPGPMFLALPPVEMEWPQRLALGRRIRRERDGRATTTCCAPPGREVRALLRALPVRLGGRDIWRCGSAPRARRWRHRPPAPPAPPRSSSASRRSAAARRKPHWSSAPTHRSIRRA